MAAFGITVSVLFLLYALFKYKIKFNPLVIFTLLWTVIFVLASIRLYGLKAGNDSTYFIMGIGILFWSLGYCLSYNKISFKSITKRNGNIGNNYKCRYNLIYLLSIITLILYLKDLLSIISSVNIQGLLAQVRSLAQDSDSILYEGRSNIETAIRLLITQPFLMALQPIVAVEFWFKTKERKRLLVIDLILVFLRMFTDGSRSMVMYLGFHFLIVFLILSKPRWKSFHGFYKDKIASSKKAKRIMCLLGIGFIIVFIISSVSRSGSRMWKYLYLYFSMEPYMMTYWKGQIQHFGFGTASLNGLVYPIIYFVKNLLGISEYPDYWYNNIFLLINDTDSKWQIITTTGNPANAYVSVFWFPYLDGGIVGEILVMFIYGFAAGYLFKKAIRNLDMKSICIYSLFFQGIIMSYVRFQFATSSYALAFLYLVIVFYKKSNHSFTQE